MYHYTECGLRNVWLVNGYKIHKTEYGDGVSIDHADDLHQVIAHTLVHRKSHLTGCEFRFIRKLLDMSQNTVALVMGVDVQSVARWEKGRVPKMADRYLRFVYRESIEGNAHVIETIERLNELDEAREDKLTYQETTDGWKSAA